ncbi:MAG: hypothetical protein JST33_02985 [Actinobacteria bacterium]|nr:hypothetical protein [Actinomycetota bacterium]
MYIGHYAAAAVLLAVFPETPAPAVAVGVAWPDLVWPVLVMAGKEKVTVDPDDPLQRSLRFDSYPFSHSLVLSNLLALVPALVFAALYQSWSAGLVFWLAAVSHWLLDLVVHRADLPVLGFGSRDRTWGAGLWRLPKTAFLVEYAFFAVVILAVAPSRMLPGLLLGGLLLHALNANSFFGFTRRNPVGTPRRYALLTLVGYVAATVWFLLSWR